MEAQVAADISRQASARAQMRERKKRGLPVDQDIKKQAAGEEESATQVDALMEEVMKEQDDEEGYKDEEDDEDDEMGIKAGMVRLQRLLLGEFGGGEMGSRGGWPDMVLG